MADGDKWRERGETFRGAGMALAIPFTLVGTPVIGAAIGYWVAQRTGWNGWMFIGGIFGAVVGVRETISIVRKLSADTKDPKGPVK